MTKINKSLESIFYVYIYLNPLKSGNYNYEEFHFDYEPFYVGRGKRNRLNDHLKEAKRISEEDLENQKEKKYNKHKINTIKKIKRELNDDPIILKIKTNLLFKESQELEKYLIKIIGRDDLGLGPLTNLTDGGDGTINVSEESKKLAVSKTRKKREENPFILENVRLKNIETWSNPDKKKEHSELMTEIQNKPDVIQRREKRISTPEYKEKSLKNVLSSVEKRELNYKENPEYKQEVLKRNIESNKKTSEIRWSDPNSHIKASNILLEYYAKQKIIRFECYDLIDKYSLDIKRPFHGKGIDFWIKFKEELLIIIKDLEAKK